MKIYNILAITLFIFTLSALALDKAKVEKLMTGEPGRKNMARIKDSIERVRNKKSLSNRKPVDWEKLIEENNKRNSQLEGKVGPGQAKQGTQVSTKKINETGGANSQKESKGSKEMQSQSKSKGKGEVSEDSENSDGQEKWQTVGPLSKEIRVEEVKEPTPKPLSPEELKYQKEKEEFLKQFKSNAKP